MCVCARAVFDEESVVSKLVNPENKDLVAMAVGAIGPCISAPIFEEVLYRSPRPSRLAASAQSPPVSFPPPSRPPPPCPPSVSPCSARVLRRGRSPLSAARPP